jgi:hypothetical protein
VDDADKGSSHSPLRFCGLIIASITYGLQVWALAGGRASFCPAGAVGMRGFIRWTHSGMVTMAMLRVSWRETAERLEAGIRGGRAAWRGASLAWCGTWKRCDAGVARCTGGVDAAHGREAPHTGERGAVGQGARWMAVCPILSGWA